MKTIIKSFAQLTNEELYEILKLRIEVFIVEQNCPYQDIDGLDRQCLHAYLQDDDGVIQAYVRILPPGLKFTVASIGRVISCTRRQGLGTKIMKTAISYIFDNYATANIMIEAQVYAKNFYELLGFVCCSDIFLEDDIPHVRMILNKDDLSTQR